MTRKSFKTPKGTELPLLNLKGKEYLMISHRLVWFREERPNWGIETELIKVTDDSCLAKTTIKDESGRIMATAHKFEDKKGFADFIEKSESSSCGRALAMIGFGTQFCADELDEGERLADSPIESKSTKLIETAKQMKSKANGKSESTDFWES